MVDAVARNLAASVMSVTPSTYLGFVGTRCFQPTDTIGTVGWQINNRTVHRARDRVSSLQVIFPGYYVNTSEVETANTGTVTITAAIEYPLGTTSTSLKFSGSTTGTIPNGSTLTSDALSLNMPDGALFAVRTFVQGTVAISYLSTWIATAGDSCEASASGLTNRTTATGSYGSAPTFMYTPSGIIGNTNKASMIIYGDSKQLGSGDITDGALDTGPITRAFGPVFAYANCSRTGGTGQGFVASHTNRVALAVYASHVVIGYFFNDFAAGRTAVQMETDLASIVSYFPNKPIYTLTISPKTTGAWTAADASDQTVTGGEANRVTFNNDMRANLIANVSLTTRGFIDIALINETSYNSGKWVPGTTIDGVHENTIGCLKIKGSNLLDSSQFRR